MAAGHQAVALRLERIEQLRGYAIAALSALVIFAVSRPWEGGGRSVWFALGVLFPAALAFAASRGHRVWTAVAAFVLVFDPGWGPYYIVAAMPLAYAFLLVRRGRRLMEPEPQERPTPT